MHSLETIKAMNAKGAPKQPQGATVKIDTTHQRTYEPVFGLAKPLPGKSEPTDDDGQYEELLAERPLSPKPARRSSAESARRLPASPAWSHKLYFGTGRNAELTVGKEQDVFEIARSFITARADVLFLGFTLTEAIGCWVSESERSFILEVITAKRSQFQDEIVGLAKLYKDRFNQDAVVATHTQTWMELV